ncbi:amino acid transporter [Solihabitans fulvus]|uniref:Amino acid transporter n=1 Tax=Solihabitans fulvus TaxID=1892852 RepID=A0A5B2X0J4_9PSEU|nr:amino acid transporter [Solihabitans fulvus]KAA2256928.1 amino acid transporter [Solihabitans fulvus]
MTTTANQERATDRTSRFRSWLLEGLTHRHRKLAGPHKDVAPHETQPWWKVMCLTGVDYFSTLGYQPGIAALAAGVVSPLATLVLVALTLFGALPVYRRVARESPHGQGSLAMLEHLLPRWWGKILILVLLGFVATDFIITITLSAADATAHAVENPFMPSFFGGHNVLLTLVLIALLGVVFLKGFTEAIGIAVGLVGVYLALNVVVVFVAVRHVIAAPHLVVDWQNLLISQHGNPWVVVGVALIVFPKLALGLSGFETGASVMPMVRGGKDDDPLRPEGRIRNTRKLLGTAAVIMSVFLITTSFTTTLLIPQAEFQPGGQANGRAMAFLAHEYLGSGFGTVYDLSTIAILWFAGASAMAGLLNIVPRYLPRYGMAPDWTRAMRPLVLVFVVISFAITIIFNANVDAQGGAYATGVLVLISSAAVAVTLSVRRRGKKAATVAFGVITVVFLYTTAANIIERPDGVKIATFFIVAIIVTSLVSRAMRSTELRVTEVEMDETALRFLTGFGEDKIRIIANEPDDRDEQEYREKEREQRDNHGIPEDAPLLFLEVTVVDSSEFESSLKVTGEERFGYRILRAESTAVPNAIAAVLLHVRDVTGQRPHVFFAWMEGNPVWQLLGYVLTGEGDVPPLTREVLRRAEPDAEQRPMVHVG